MVLYDYDSNYIFAQAFKNLDAFKIIHQQLVSVGLQPKLHRLDHECSTILKAYLQDANIDFQLVPPGLHCRNAAERAICTFQNQFIAGLCSTNPNFPIALWDELIPQAEYTIGMLRGSRLNPKLSAYQRQLRL